jgi:hypothetical protein
VEGSSLPLGLSVVKVRMMIGWYLNSVILILR